ncbi:MAG: hypothetical protein J6M15_01930 [Prevotella sp.]|nr:hypothetical protein [Prevotella sp.]
MKRLSYLFLKGKLEARTFDPRSPGLRPLEAAPSTHGARGFANPMQYFGEHGDTKTQLLCLQSETPIG